MNNSMNLRLLTPRIMPSYTPQHGDRIVTTDSVTSPPNVLDGGGSDWRHLVNTADWCVQRRRGLSRQLLKRLLSE